MGKLFGVIVLLAGIAGGGYYYYSHIKEKPMSEKEYLSKLEYGCKRVERSVKGVLACVCNGVYVAKNLGGDGAKAYLSAVYDRDLGKAITIWNIASNGDDADRVTDVNRCIYKIEDNMRKGWRYQGNYYF